jgi:Ca2+-transporting ATPase
MQQKPKKKDENILTPAMTTNILATAGFYIVVMLALLLMLKGTPETPGLWAGTNDNNGNRMWLVEDRSDTIMLAEKDMRLVETKDESTGKVKQEWQTGTGDEVKAVKPTFTLHQASLFFTIYIFFQVWNMINCRSLVPETSGLVGVFRNPTFLGILSAIVVMQVVIVMFLGGIFQVEPLTGENWLWIVLGTSSVLVFAEIARRVRLAMNR